MHAATSNPSRLPRPGTSASSSASTDDSDLTPCLKVNWPAPPRVRAWCSTRLGGVSVSPYASLNLGDHVGDDPGAVLRNRQRYAQMLEREAGQPVRPIYLQQVHGCASLRLTPATQGGCADAALTASPGLACTVMVADCLPVLFCHQDGRAVAAAHAGWRGLLGRDGVGVLNQVLDDFCALARIPRAQTATQIIAWMGPCIGPSAFEVGDEVQAAFVASRPWSQPYFRPCRPGHAWADLPGLARAELERLGVTQVFGNDGGADWCTVSQPDRYFSHRRDGVSGRMAASVWINA